MYVRKRYIVIFGLCTAVLLGCTPSSSESFTLPTPDSSETEPIAKTDQDGETGETAVGETLPSLTQTEPDILPSPAPTNDALQTRLALRQTLRATLPARAERVELDVPTVTGEVPEGVLTAVYQLLLTQFGHARDQVKLLRAESVVWPDGSLGCPQPGEFYTQAPVSGYWIEIEVGSQRYDYRATSADNLRLCQNPLQLQTRDTNR